MNRPIEELPANAESSSGARTCEGFEGGFDAWLRGGSKNNNRRWFHR
jgi:hypothetical protein